MHYWCYQERINDLHDMDTLRSFRVTQILAVMRTHRVETLIPVLYSCQGI